MYPSVERCEELAAHDPRPVILCEYQHAMGNSNGYMKEYWQAVRRHPSFQVPPHPV
jgi:beta-galactosidase